MIVMLMQCVFRCSALVQKFSFTGTFGLRANVCFGPKAELRIVLKTKRKLDPNPVGSRYYALASKVLCGVSNQHSRLEELSVMLAKHNLY